MTRFRLLTRSLLAAALSGLAFASLAAAQSLEPGDIIVPGNRVVDGFGAVHGCFYRFREGVVTRLFQSELFRSPKDMIVDSQGRLVFRAGIIGGNINDTGLFRIDPATGTLERLFRFPYIVAPGDTLPSGAGTITQFPYGSPFQSLHFEKRFDITIDDDVNGGWPQIHTGETYGFSITTAAASGTPPTAFRYDPASGRCDVGISTALIPAGTTPCMASDDEFVYYGSSRTIARTGVPTTVELHFDGDWGQLDLVGRVPPRNVVVVNAQVLDNTRDSNVTIACGPTVDTEVPLYSTGAPFASLSMDGLGLLGGSLYVSANSGSTRAPFVFDIVPRAPYLNPNACQWFPATKGNGPLAFSLPDFTPTAAPNTSPDGDGLLGVGSGVLKRTDPQGGYEVLDASQPYTGRPWRWHGPSQSAYAPAAGSDSGAQVLVMRADARVNVLLADAQGRRIGHDAAGQVVNDFGESGQVLSGDAGGWPRLILLRDPLQGVFEAEVHAIEAGAWEVRSYLAHEGGGSQVATAYGSATGAGSELRGLHVGQPTELAWYASPLAVEGPIERVRMGFVSVGPVPSRGEVQLAYRVPGSGARVRLDILDVAGRLVATPIRGLQSGGTHTLTWRGESASGVRLAHGIYLASLEVDGRRETRRVVLAE